MTSLEELLGQMHTALAQEMLNRIMSGEATTSDLNVARQFLKDNEVTSVARPGNPVFQLAERLPFEDLTVAQGE